MYKTKLNKILNLIEKVKNDITLPIISEFLEWFYDIIDIHFNKEKPNLILNKGEIYFVNLGRNIGSELNKNRPCVILSQTYFNNGNTVLILPIKSYKGKINKGSQLLIDINILKNKSVVDFLSIRQIDKKRIHNYLGTIGKNNIKKIDKRITKIFGIKNKE